MKKMYVSKSQDSIRMFKYTALELFSKVHFSVPLIIYLPVIIYLTYLGTQSTQLSVLGLLGILFSGIFVWSITEYILHRFVFHYHPTSDFGKKIHFIFHGVHHDYPQDRLRLVMPPAVSIPLALGFFLFFNLFMAPEFLYTFFAGFLLGYLIYDMLHYAIHHVHFKGKVWNILKTHHLKHHYADDTKGFGVSSPIWDIVIKSNFSKNKLGSKKTKNIKPNTK